MEKLLKNIVKTSIAFFIIGAAITLASGPLAEVLRPVLVDGLGLEGAAGVLDKASKGATLAGAAWSGSFFAMFGALSPVIPPLVGKIMGMKPEGQQAPQVSVAQGKGVSVKLEHAVERGHETDVHFPLEPEEPQTKFSTKITAERHHDDMAHGKNSCSSLSAV